MGDIYIKEPVLEKQRLISQITVTPNLGKYIKNNRLFVEYDTDIQAEDSILNIPIIATVLPLAWLTGSDIHVAVLDRRFKESMTKLKNLFAEMYPKASFNTEIKVNRLEDNNIIAKGQDNRTGLLFSGGVDSTYSLMKNIDLNPQLVMIWGFDNFPYPERADYWKKVTETYQSFAENKRLDINIIKTNITQILNEIRIEHMFHKELYDGTMREGLRQSILPLAVAAPLSINRFNHFLIAASFMHGLDFSVHPRATLPELDETIAWANLEVEHHGFLDRTEKIIYLSKILEKDTLQLRVCVRSKLFDDKLNDSKCEKCIRTFLPIMLLGIDPNSCGFNVDETTFKTIMDYWEQKSRPLVPFLSYRKMQNMISPQMDYNIPGSKEFIEWFRDFDFPPSTKNWFYTDLHMKLPYPLARLMFKLYNKLNIDVRGGPCKR